MNWDAATASVVVAGIAAVGTCFNTLIQTRQSKRVKETHKQVTVNHHSSDFPTVLDRIDDVRVAVIELGREQNETRGELNKHIAHSNRMDQRLIAIELTKTAEHELRLSQAEQEIRLSQ